MFLCFYGIKFKIVVYMDSVICTSRINRNSSQYRNNHVVYELEKIRVECDKINKVAHGGVNDLSPISFNRRASVQITE